MKYSPLLPSTLSSPPHTQSILLNLPTTYKPTNQQQFHHHHQDHVEPHHFPPCSWFSSPSWLLPSLPMTPTNRTRGSATTRTGIVSPASPWASVMKRHGMSSRTARARRPSVSRSRRRIVRMVMSVFVRGNKVSDGSFEGEIHLLMMC
jgi:hypothetical protein